MAEVEEGGRVDSVLDDETFEAERCTQGEECGSQSSIPEGDARVESVHIETFRCQNPDSPVFEDCVRDVGCVLLCFSGSEEGKVKERKEGKRQSISWNHVISNRTKQTYE